MTTVITKNGLAAACRAGQYGPNIKITGVKIGSSLITPNSSMTDVVNQVWSGGVESILYQIANDSTVIFKITLDQTIGDFDIGNIGLFLDTGELFCITGLPAISFKQKTMLPDTAGNRRVFNIPIVLSGIATITDLSILVADEANIPTVQTELLLPDAMSAPYSVYQVLQHTGLGVPALALRVDTAWWYIPSQIGNGSGIQFNADDFDPVDPPLVGDAVRFNPDTQLFEKADGANYENGFIGFRGENNTIVTSGVYKNPTSTEEIPAYTTGLKYYADTGLNKGKLTTTPTKWYVGMAVNPHTLLIGAQNITEATEEYAGSIQLATAEETINGASRTKAVTPYTLALTASNRPNEFSNGQFYVQDTTEGHESVLDWNILSAGVSSFGISFINHNRSSWIEGPTNYLRLRHTSMDTSSDLSSMFYQRVPGASKMQNLSKMVSFRARGSVSGMTIAVGAIINFGTGGSPSSQIVLPTVNIVLGNDWNNYEVNFNIPQLVGVYTFGSNNDDYIQYFLGVYPTSLNYVDLDWIKLETGSFASPITASTYEYTMQNEAAYIYADWTFKKNMEIEGNLTVDGDIIGKQDLLIDGSGGFTGNLGVDGRLNVTGNVATDGTLTVAGRTVLSDVLDVTKGTTLRSTLAVNGATTLSNKLTVTGATELNSTADIKGNLKVNTDKFTVTASNGNTAIAGTLSVAGNTTLNGNATVEGTIAVKQEGSNVFSVNGANGNTSIAGTLGVTGATSLAGDVKVNTNKFTVAASSGNTVVGGTLTVNGATTLNGLKLTGDFNVNDKFKVLAASGNTTVSGTLGVTGATSLTGDLKVNTNKFTVTASNGNTAIAGTLTTTGATTLNSTAAIKGDLAVNTDKFKVTASNGNTAIAGTLSVGGRLSLDKDVVIQSSLYIQENGNNIVTINGANGNINTQGTLTVAGASTIGGNLTVNGGTVTATNFNGTATKAKWA